MAVEWLCEWIAFLLSNWTLLQILDYVRGFGVIIVVVFFFYQSSDRVKLRHYQAWQVINTAQGKGGNGGWIEALQELNTDRTALVGVDLSEPSSRACNSRRAILRAQILARLTYATPS